MPAPKSVVKFRKKNGNVNIEYISNVDAAEYTIKELCRAALRDVGKFAKKQFSADFYQNITKRTGKSGSPKGVGYKVYSSKSTLYPRVDIYINTNNKRSYLAFQEVGSSKTKKHGILTKAVMNNVPQILAIESQYLSAVDPGASAPISEGDVIEE